MTPAIAANPTPAASQDIAALPDSAARDRSTRQTLLTRTHPKRALPAKVQP